MTQAPFIWPAAILLLIALPAQADAIRVPAGMMLCRTAADAARPDHAGCWFARGGQRVERINPAVTWSQLVIRSTDGTEELTVYARKVDADRMQVPQPGKEASNGR